MPIYKGRRPGTHRVVIWANNQSHESVVEGTKAEARAFEARRRVELEQEQLSTRVSPSFSDFVKDVYTPHALLHLRASTWNEVRVYQVDTLDAFFGKTKLSAITERLVDRFKVSRVGRRNSSINNELRVLGTILRFAAAQGYPAAKPTWKKLPPDGAPRVHAWTDDELQRLFDAARVEYAPLLPMLIWLANTGCRKGEAIACEWSWVDERRGLLRIPSNEVWRPKNGLPREVPISNAMRAVMQQRRHERWLFPNADGERYRRFPKDLYWRIRNAAGLKGGVHQLRHTFASHFLEAVPDMFLLGKVLGHSTQRVTELYAHLLPGHLERAKGAVDLAPRLQTMATTMAKASK